MRDKPKCSQTQKDVDQSIFLRSVGNDSTILTKNSKGEVVEHLLNELRTQKEIADRIAEEKYKVLTSLLPEMVLETNVKGQLVFVNLKAITVFEYGSDFYVNNLNLVELISKADRRRCSKDLKKFAENESDVFEAEYTAVTKSGKKFPVMLHVTKMYSDKQFSGLNVLMLDKSVEKRAENYQVNLSFLSKSALNFLTLSNDDDIFIFVGKTLSKFASKSVIVVFSYDQISDISKIRYVSAGIPYISELINIIGKSPEDFDIKLPEKFRRKYLSNKILKKLDSLKDFWVDDFAKETIDKIEKLLDVDDLHSMGIVRDGKLYGGLLIANRNEAKAIDSQTIETFIYQAGIALHRIQIDNELMKAKLAAEESDRLKSAFLANMSHELRTPLNGILGLAQVMFTAENIDPEIKENVKMIVESGNSLLSLIEDIMDLSKIEAEQLKIKNMPFVLNTLMEQLYSIFTVHPIYIQKNSAQKNIDLIYDKPDYKISIISDPDRLKQIFINLISNALKFTQKGFIRYGCSVNKDDITFYVKDSGIGIPKDQTEKVFERFTQVDSTLSRKSKGSGLGLAISKGLTTLLNGEIWCESVLGTGSSFFFTIPYISAAMPPNFNTLREANDMIYDWSDYTILIVEDDKINFKVIRAMLHKTKVNIIHADNGLNAIEQICLNPQIDLVLMDVHLPEISGLEATGRIMEINPSLPIIAQTANAMADDKDRCIEAGCADYISKPIDMKTLLSKIAKFLSNSSNF